MPLEGKYEDIPEQELYVMNSICWLQQWDSYY